MENPYLQYLIGLPGYQDTPLFDASTLVLFRKRITADILCEAYGLQFPRCYCRKARKDYLAYAKSRKHTKKQIRTAIRKQLSYVRRDICYLEGYFIQGYVPDSRDIPVILTIIKLYEQQEYMYKNKIHSVPERIVSISQP